MLLMLTVSFSLVLVFTADLNLVPQIGQSNIPMITFGSSPLASLFLEGIVQLLTGEAIFASQFGQLTTPMPR